MFENLTDRLDRIFTALRGQGRLTEENMANALREVRKALLEADVALPVVRDFIEHIRQQTLGKEILNGLNPGQAVISIVKKELVSLMGETNAGLNLDIQPPAVVLVAGLQGAGKTTTVAKLACSVKEKTRKKIMVTSCDIYRPAAIDQLQKLTRDTGILFYPSNTDQQPPQIAKDVMKFAKQQFVDVLLVDSAGRLHVDEAMMQEIKQIHEVLNPVETLFVVDSMMGQDAVNAAKAFDSALPLTGIILTKTDGDARGGAALSVRQVTGKPIKYMGTGEKISALVPFYPERIASRILGMGDMLSLIEEMEEKADREKAEKIARKMKTGKGFTLEDFQEQIHQMRNMGGIGTLLDKLPGMPAIPKNIDIQTGDREFVRLDAIINSMTPTERQRPDTINGSRKRRIACGSGTQVQDVNRLLKQFKQMQKMMKRLSKKGGLSRLLQAMGGKLPPGNLPNMN